MYNKLYRYILCRTYNNAEQILVTLSIYNTVRVLYNIYSDEPLHINSDSINKIITQSLILEEEI